MQMVRGLGSHFPDPLDLFAALTRQGDGSPRPDTLLFESAEQANQQGERSLLVTRSALRARCRGREVEVVALNENGQSVLPWLGRQLTGLVSLEKLPDGLRARYPEPPRGSEESRLKAPSPIDVLRTLATRFTLVSGQPALGPLVAGVFAYDFLGCYESLPPWKACLLDWPDYEFWLPDQMVWLNHGKRHGTAVMLVFGGEHLTSVYHDAAASIASLMRVYEGLPESGESAPEGRPPSGAGEPSGLETDMDDAAYMSIVERLKGHIVSGDVIQVVPSRTFSVPCAKPLSAYRRLRAINPSPYMFLVRSESGTLFGASPETALKVSGSPRKIEIRPIAGTRPRGKGPDGLLDLDQDNRLEAELRLSAKENAEHMMLVDLARNDVARVSLPSSRGVTRLLQVDKYSHVMHLVSCVTGELRSDLDALDAYVATMNMGTLVGAPKLKAAELLRRYEPSRRGPYGGAAGYFTAEGELDTCIVIRSAVVREGRAFVRAGAGIVFDSEPRAEADETRHKAAAVLQAIAQSERGGA